MNLLFIASNKATDDWQIKEGLNGSTVMLWALLLNSLMRSKWCNILRPSKWLENLWMVLVLDSVSTTIINNKTITTGVRLSSTVPETCQIDAEAHWSYIVVQHHSQTLYLCFSWICHPSVCSSPTCKP